MQSEDGDIRFEPAMPEHYAMLAEWLAAPHMRQWWGEPDEELGFIRDMVEGRDTTRPFLIVLGDVPVGYIQCWFLGDHQNAEWVRDHPWLAELSREAVGVDLSIDLADRLSKGIGSAALAAFANRLRTEGRDTIIIDPDPANTRAVRAYRKAGFRPIPQLEGRTRNVLLMHFEPNPTEVRP